VSSHGPKLVDSKFSCGIFLSWLKARDALRVVLNAGEKFQKYLRTLILDMVPK